MKRVLTILAGIMMMTAAAQQSYAQEITKVYRPGTFTRVSVSSVYDVFLHRADSSYLEVITDSEFLEPVKLKLKDDMLKITLGSDPDAKIHIYSPQYQEIMASGSCDIKTVDVIKGRQVDIHASGSSDVILELDIDYLVMRLSGASDVKLRGRVDTIVGQVSGAADLKAFDATNIYAKVYGSGASDIQLNTDSVLIADISGASSVKFKKEPAHKEITAEGAVSSSEKTQWVGPNGEEFSVEENEDTTRIRYNNNEIIVIDGDDGTKVLRKKIEKTSKKRRRRFRGNWAGLELGINGYVVGNKTLDLPQEYAFLELNYPKSTNFNLNFFQQSVNLIANRFGLVTGLGFRWNNYRFYSANTVLVPDSGVISGYYDQTAGTSYIKSKLTSSYLTLPLLLEFQTNRHHGSGSFHIAVGVIGGVRLSTHTKQVYTFNGSGKNKPKVYDDFFLQPFFADGTLRIGWGPLNLYATYSLTEMFRKNRGPVLYPFSAGLILPFS